MDSYEFRIGGSQAKKVADELRFRHQTVTNPFYSLASRLLRRPRSLRELGASFTTPLESLKKEIPLDDVSTDIEDFGIISDLAKRSNRELPVMRMGPEKKPVPVLPPHELSQAVFDEYLPFPSTSKAKFLFEKVMDDALFDDRIQMKSISEARDAFFDGLHQFLWMRIGGIRWARNQSHDEREKLGITDSPPEVVGGQFFSGSSASFASDDRQAWMIYTDQDGLSLGYGGTHAVRTVPTYLGAETSPLQVYLPMGTLFLAANAGPDGKYVWDDEVEIEVPSLTPIYKTERF